MDRGKDARGAGADHSGSYRRGGWGARAGIETRGGVVRGWGEGEFEGGIGMKYTSPEHRGSGMPDPYRGLRPNASHGPSARGAAQGDRLEVLAALGNSSQIYTIFENLVSLVEIQGNAVPRRRSLYS